MKNQSTDTKASNTMSMISHDDWFAFSVALLTPMSLVTSKLSNSAFPVWKKGLTQMSDTLKYLQ